MGSASSVVNTSGGSQHLLVKVVQYDFGLEPYGMVMAFYMAAQLLFGPLGVELRIVLGHLDQLVIAVHWCVGLERIQDQGNCSYPRSSSPRSTCGISGCGQRLCGGCAGSSQLPQKCQRWGICFTLMCQHALGLREG